jgi:hypothetical protein
MAISRDKFYDIKAGDIVKVIADDDELHETYPMGKVTGVVQPDDTNGYFQTQYWVSISEGILENKLRKYSRYELIDVKAVKQYRPEKSHAEMQMRDDIRRELYCLMDTYGLELHRSDAEEFLDNVVRSIKGCYGQ